MASITPRASGFWTNSTRSSYFPGDMSEDEDDDPESQHMLEDNMMEHDGRTPLDKTIDRIGMGMWNLVLFLTARK